MLKEEKEERTTVHLLSTREAALQEEKYKAIQQEPAQQQTASTLPLPPYAGPKSKSKHAPTPSKKS